jgi:hypothetical protein
VKGRLGTVEGCLCAFYKAKRGAQAVGNKAGEVGAIDCRLFWP